MQKQQEFEFPMPRVHGGSRKGAGRKRVGPRARVTHEGRTSFGKPRVLHVTCRLGVGLPSLRALATVAIVMAYLARSCEKSGFRLVEYSIQGNHLHLICEAVSNEALSKATNGLLSGLARMLNRHWGRRGQVFEDRYHVEIIETPTQCRNALLYVLHNAKKHGARSPRSGADPCSTAPWFPFASWTNIRSDRKPAAKPRTWLLKHGYRRARGGNIHLHDHPLMPTKQSRPKANPSRLPSRQPQ